jgi:putative ABC transport system substrate-binding protein
MNRRAFVTGLGAVLATARGGEAQQARKVYRIGFLGGTSPSQYAVYVEAMRQGLRDLGYVEGRNLPSSTVGPEENTNSSALSLPSWSG